MHRLAIIYQYPNLYIDYIQITLNLIELDLVWKFLKIVLVFFFGMCWIFFNYIDCIIDFDLFFMIQWFVLKW